MGLALAVAGGSTLGEAQAAEGVQSSALESEQPCPAPAKPLAVLAGVVPGALVHGSGHFVRGCPRFAPKFLWVELSGLGLVLLSLAPVPVFGANPVLVPFLAFTAMSGAALFIGSWLLDVYGSAVSPASRGRSVTYAPLLESRFGYRYVYDPLFDYRHFAVQGFDLRLGALSLMPELELAPGGHNARYRLPVAYRIVGATPDEPSRDGTWVDTVAALTHHFFGRDGFGITTAEVSAQGRLDLARFAADLGGTFAELGLGVGVNRFEYQAPGAGHDDNSLLLMNFAFGSTFGDPNHRGGEVKLGYDHRHDDFAAGTKLEGLGSGVIGHFGVESKVYLDDHFGLSFQAQVGSAYVLSTSLLYRQGGRRAD